MTTSQTNLPKWLLIVTGIFALMEIGASIALIFSPDSVASNVDLGAKGVVYLMYMWAARQFALGVILAVAAIKRSEPMLSLAWIFFLVMMVGDLVIGILQKDNGLIIGALVMSVIAAALLFAINKKRA